MGGFHQIEEFFAVGDVDGGTAQLVVKRRVVQQVQVVEHEQTCRLIVRIECDEGAEIVKGLLVHRLGVLDKIGQVHRRMSPVGHCGVEYLVGDFFHHLCY